MKETKKRTIDEADTEILDYSENDVQDILANQEFPLKKSSNNKKKKIENEGDTKESENVSDEERTDGAKELACNYLNLWKDNRKEWKFKKVRQIWLLQHMYEKPKISKSNFAILLDYLKDSKGLSRERTLEQAKKILEEDDGEASGRTKRIRAREILRTL